MEGIFFSYLSPTSSFSWTYFTAPLLQTDFQSGKKNAHNTFSVFLPRCILGLLRYDHQALIMNTIYSCEAVNSFLTFSMRHIIYSSYMDKKDSKNKDFFILLPCGNDKIYYCNLPMVYITWCHYLQSLEESPLLLGHTYSYFQRPHWREDSSTYYIK